MRERIFAQDVSSCFNCLFSAIPSPVVRQSCPPPTPTLQQDLPCGAGGAREGRLSQRVREELEMCGGWLLEKEVMSGAGRRVEERAGPACCLGSAYPVSLNVHVCVV